MNKYSLITLETTAKKLPFLKKKELKRYFFNGLVIAGLILFLLFLVTAAKPLNESSSQGNTGESFIDPVTLRIENLTNIGYSREQITAELRKTGMGWEPTTGATWICGCNKTLDLNSLDRGKAIEKLTRKASVMRTSDYLWNGISTQINCGTMDVSLNATQDHYICVQIGDLDGITSWTEVLIMHNYGKTYQWYTYDSDEGGLTYYMDKNTPLTHNDTYVIALDGTCDSFGWNYNIWINSQWVRHGHVLSPKLQIGFQKEVYSLSGHYCDDNTSAIFCQSWLHNTQDWVLWTRDISTTWSTTYPMHEAHEYSNAGYTWKTWVQR